MTLTLSFPRNFFRNSLIALLTFFLLSCGTAAVREHVIVKLQENGMQRIYETEVHRHTSHLLRVTVLKIGRKPLNIRPLGRNATLRPPDVVLASLSHRPAAPRGPPIGPRAPPIA